MRGFVLAAGVMALALPGVAGAVNSYGKVTLPPGLTKVAAATPDKQMCVTEDVTGSRLESNHICHTAAQWIEIKHQQQVMLPIANLNAAQCPNPSQCVQ